MLLNKLPNNLFVQKSLLGLMKSLSQTCAPKYIAERGKLSDDQKQFYQEHGYLIIPGLVPEIELEKYKKRFSDIANRTVKVPGLVVQKDVAFLDQPYNENTVYKLQELFTDEQLFAYCRYEPILDYAQSFTGPNMMAIHTMLINKPPDSGQKTSRHPLHQDLYYFPIRPAERIVAVWTAMEKVNRENGCLVAWPGSHRGKLLDHGYPDWAGVNKAFHGILNFDKTAKRVYLEMEAGDSVFFHPLLVHGSDVRGTNQQVIGDEIIEMAKKKYNVEVEDVADVWRFRATLVRGERRNI